MIKIKDSLVEEKIKEEKEEKRFYAWLLLILLLFSVILYVNNRVLGCVIVEGSSMQNTFYTDDILFTNKLATPDYESVVIIEGESPRGLLIKRVIAKGGDTVKIANGQVYLMHSYETEFQLLDEPYIKDQGKTFYPSGSQKKDAVIIKVPSGEYFYLGDNRLVSNDSRSDFGTCKLDQITGVVPKWAIKYKDEIRILCTISIKIRSFFNLKTQGVSD